MTVESAGDISVTARLATPEGFAPYGRLLTSGDRARLGRAGAVLLALDDARPGPRRTTHLVRYPEARRVLFPLRPDASLLLVVLPPGEQPGGPPVAFRTPEGAGVLLHAGVWHAGPVPLRDVPLLELLETTGPADRFDRRGLGDLVGAEAVRVVLPEEPGAPGSSLDLSVPDAVSLSPSLRGRVRLACATLDGLTVPVRSQVLVDQEALEIARLRETWGRAGDLTQVPGIAEGRAVLLALGIDPESERPPGEAALAAVLHGRSLDRRNALADAVRLFTLTTRRVATVYDAVRLGDRMVLREEGGSPGAGQRGAARVVLADRDGSFGSLTEDYPRSRVGPSTTRALVVLWLPPEESADVARAHLDRLIQAVGAACGGVATGRFVTTT